MNEVYDGLLDALRGLPNLGRGLCVGDDPALWDETVDPAIIARNIGICHQCECIKQCEEYSTNSNAQLNGVIGGILFIHQPPKRRRKNCA